jgi:hypothetical protein
MMDPKVEVVSSPAPQTTFTAEIPVANAPTDAFAEMMGGSDDNVPF